jgi:hypothetical protein
MVDAKLGIRGPERVTDISLALEYLVVAAAPGPGNRRGGNRWWRGSTAGG